MRVLLTSILTLFVFGFSATTVADEQATTYELDIEAQALSGALKSFAEQTDLQVVYFAAVAEGKDAPALEGEFTADAALEQLLANVDLEVQNVDARTYSIAPLSEVSDERGARDPKNLEHPRPVLMGQNQSSREQQTEQNKEEASSDLETKAGADVQALDEIVVTGTTIRGVAPRSSPLDIYSIEEIELSGATTVNRFLETLPQNVNTQAPGAGALIGGGVEGPPPTDTGGVNLRGFGTGTTLTLLNGRRLAGPSGESVNTALIPLGVVERIEVLSDGASAAYGSDSIGGVVNFVLKEDLEGAEFSASYGLATRGGQERYQAELAVGNSWNSGSGFISYGYFEQSPLDLGERDFSSGAPSPFFINPDERMHNLLLTVDQGLSERLAISSTALLSSRNAELRRSTGVEETFQRSDEDQFFLTAALEYELASDLFFQVDGTFLSDQLSSETDRLVAQNRVVDEQDGESLDFMAKVDGNLFNMPGGTAKFSAGGGYSEQSFKQDIATLPDPLESLNDVSRDSYFVFGELFMPLVGEQQSISGINSLELNVSYRYTDYSDFGNASTPRLGVLWSPVKGFNFRGSYSRGFRAPELRAIGTASLSALVFNPTSFFLPDPFSDDQSSIYLLQDGTQLEGLAPEFSDNIAIGFDISPEAIPRFRLSLTYYNIDYDDRLGRPVPSTLAALANPDEFSFIFDADPTLTDLAAFFELVPPGQVLDFTGQISDPVDPNQAASLITVVVDNLFQNLAISKSEGLDLSLGYAHDTGVGTLSYGLRGTRILNSVQQAAPETPEFDNVGFVGTPNTLRGNAYIGLTRGQFGGRLTLQYVDDYVNNAVAPEEKIESWTTFDLALSYDFDDAKKGILSGTRFSIAVQNLFDEDPPFVAVRTVAGGAGLVVPAGYDPVNANPLGRFATFSLRKAFY